jgi:hydroxymethylpyrimidine/phosphomethylpyrimidine kinase
MKGVMIIATSNSGVDIQADLTALLRCGVYGSTAIVARNTVGVNDGERPDGRTRVS